MPSQLFDIVLGGFVSHSATFLLKLLEDRGYARGETIVSPGDPFGRVLAWLWGEHPSVAMSMVAMYVAELRYHHPNRLTDPPIAFEDVLRWLPLALDTSDEETHSLIAQAREKVPEYFADDINR